MIKTNKIYLFFILTLCVVVMSSCSTKKNTSSARFYHQMTTVYNINFNGKDSYEDGIKAINKGNVDDYSRILPMYPISIKENATKASSQMDKTIEKCRKAIKKHSITRKPKRNKSRRSDPKYKYFYSQNEFVPAVKRAWIILGTAELHKGDFIGAAGTFSYIVRHYSPDLEITMEARIWLARAYSELEWYYEAEEALAKIKENDISAELTGLYSATMADLLMKQRRYAEAYPYLTVAAKKEENRFLRTRFHYILGQLAMYEGNNKEAQEWFAKVKKASPSYIMDFNTRLNLFSSQSSNKAKSVKGLKKMADHPNNIEYLDQVYHALGDVYLANEDTTKAIEAYEKGAQESVRKGKDKAALLIKTGDLHLQRKDYVAAFPCYQEAAGLIDVYHDDYRRVEKYGTVLGDVALHYNTVVLQDSLQHLATLSEDEQMKIIEKVIEQVKENEEEAARLAKEAEDKENMLARRAANRSSMAMPGGLGAGASQDWYFYNEGLKQSGLAQFTQKWGKRKLEDNWRRMDKTSSSFSDDDMALMDGDSISADGNAASANAPVDSAAMDNKQPAYYLAQIPTTPDKVDASNALIAESLYKLGSIYSVELEDYMAALDAYQEYESRFRNDSLIIEVLYSCYSISAKTGDQSEQDYYSAEIIKRFPNSTYAKMLSQPDYIDKMKAMFAQQDSIYNATYEAYNNNNFSLVKANCAMMKEKYPLSELMPKFALLNALVLGRQGDKDTMFDELTDIVAKYPDSDVAPMSKDILALINQGREAQKGAVTTIADKRQETDDAAVDSTAVLTFEFDDRDAFAVYLVPKNANDTLLNSLLYNVAFFNFTKFLVKEFDISKEKLCGYDAVKISGLAGKKEALWYEQMLLAEPSLQGAITLDVCRRVIISETNVKKILQGLTLEDYEIEYLKQ